MAEHTNTVAVTNKALSWFTGPTVKIIVGVNTDAPSRTFFVHAELLTSRSNFFAKALKNYKPSGEFQNEYVASGSEDQDSSWKEVEEGVIKLLVDKPEVVAHYVQIIYTGIPPAYDAPDKLDEEASDAKHKAKKRQKKQSLDVVGDAAYKLYGMLTTLYIFCDRVQDIVAKRLLLASFVEASDTPREDGHYHYPGTLVCAEVYANTLESDPLREFLVDCFLQGAHPDWVEGVRHDDYPHEFLFAVMVGMLKERKLPEDNIMKDAKYYQNKLDELEKGKEADGNQS